MKPLAPTINNPPLLTGPLLHPDLTLRDYFATAALTGILAAEITPLTEDRTGEEIAAAAKMRRTLRAKLAYAEADAMLAEREKSK